METEDTRMYMKRMSLRFGGYIAWGVGAVFSYMGFTSQSTGSWFWKLLGGALVLLVTILELWLNDTKTSELLSEKSTFGDILLFLGGCLSYIYDAYTNILGLTVLMLGIVHPDLSKLDWAQLIIPGIAGVFIAGLPEPMIVTSYKNQPKKKQEQSKQQSKHISYHVPTQQQPKYQAKNKPILGPIMTSSDERPWPPQNPTYIQSSRREDR